MGTIAEKLTYLNETKNAIKNAIVNKGVSVNDSDTFRSYADKISSIEAGGGSGGDAELEASFMSSIDSSLGANVTKLPKGLTAIADYAFRGCRYLALTELPEGIETIGYQSFHQCFQWGLTKLPSTLKTIGYGGFRQCENILLTDLPEGLTMLDEEAFHSCKNITLTKLPSTLTTMKGYVFYNCYKLALTELPEGITKIEDNTFYGCESLTSLNIKGNITTIEAYAFYNCKKLSTIIFSNVTSVPSITSNAFSNTPIYQKTGYIYVPDNLVESFKTATNWKTYANQIKGLSELGS